ncbi:uncharacterized protein LOC116054973 [Sander lucioperca]|uniref:uncharacterized protein LOC116054973 n=1 Tax=Sander lucioperca TaxID=283035 RepID=UPI0016538456|nr:uncharacterized protein LOC116054973 [Sander lucioperca]
MSLKLLEAKWKPALSSILEELTESEFRMMLFNLFKIPQGVKDGKAREDIPYLIVQYYGTEGSIYEIDKIMKNIPRNDAAVQQLLRPFVEKLKKQRQGKKGTMRNLGSATKKQKPAADQLKSCQPDQKKTISKLVTKALAGKVVQSSAQCTNNKKVKMDPVNAAKPKKKNETQDSSLKHQASASASINMDRVGAVETEKTDEQDSSLKPVESIKTFKVLSAAVQTGRIKIMEIKKSNKTITHLEIEFNGRRQTVFVTTQLLANAFGLKVEDDFERRLRYQMPLTAEATLQGRKVTDIKKMDPVGDVKPDQKTEEQDSSLKLAAPYKTFKDQSAGVRTGRIKILGIKKSNNTNIHLMVEFNGRKRTFFLTNRLLASAFGLKVDDDFERRLCSQMPLTAEATIQGKKKITDIKKMDSVGTVTTELKTKDASLKPAKSSKTSKVLSAAVQTGRIQIMGIKKSNKKKTHLVVEINGRMQTVFVKTQLLANAFGLKVEDDYERRLRYQMPLTAEAKLQGNKIIYLKKMLKLLEAKWETALISILEELTEEEFKKMLICLVRIPQGVKTGKVREEIPNLIVQYYGTEGSISEIDKIMQDIPRRDAAVQEPLRPFVEKLKKRQKEKAMTSRLATDPGSVTKKQKPAAGPSGKLMLEPLASAVDCIEWTLLKPVVNTVDEVQTYSFQCDAGRFECSVSALRWVCEEKLSFKYQFCSWDEHRVRLSGAAYMPAGPLLNITVTAGKMEEVHLPHWICVDHNSKMSDNFAVLHIDAFGDVWREVSEVTESHVKLLQPTFSLISVTFWRIIGLPVKVFYNVLIYMKKHPAALTLHVYLVPPDEFQKQEVEKMENSCGSVRIIKPGPDRPMQLGDHYSLTTDKTNAMIQPPMRELRDDSNNLFEVFIRNADSDVPLRLESEKNTIWTCTIYKENYLSTDPTPGPSGAIQQRNVPTEDSIPTEDSVPAEESYSTEDSVPAEERIPAEDRDPSEDSVPAEKTLFSVRTEFVERVSDDVLNQLLDKLLEHRIINDGEMQSIRTKAKADKAREVIDTVRRKGTKPSALLIADLRKLDPCLSKVLKLS